MEEILIKTEERLNGIKITELNLISFTKDLIEYNYKTDTGDEHKIKYTDDYSRMMYFVFLSSKN